MATHWETTVNNPAELRMLHKATGHSEQTAKQYYDLENQKREAAAYASLKVDELLNSDDDSEQDHAIANQAAPKKLPSHIQQPSDIAHEIPACSSNSATLQGSSKLVTQSAETESEDCSQDSHDNDYEYEAETQGTLSEGDSDTDDQESSLSLMIKKVLSARRKRQPFRPKSFVGKLALGLQTKKQLSFWPTTTV